MCHPKSLNEYYNSQTFLHWFKMHHKINNHQFLIKHPKSSLLSKEEIGKNFSSSGESSILSKFNSVPLGEISFVTSLYYFYVFMLFWMKNHLFLRCEYIAIIQRGISIFLHFFDTKLNIIINRWRSLWGVKSTSGNVKTLVLYIVHW